MLNFSTQIITFTYTQKGNPETTLTLTNKSSTPVYYKFKVNRPKFYLVKPDKGLIDTGKSIQVKIKLHRDGFSEANADKFKCFYTLADKQTTDEEMNKFQQRLNVQKTKLLVKVNNLPPGMDAARQLAGSELKSTLASRSKFGINRQSSTTYESVLKERQERVSELKNQIDGIQKSVRDKKIALGPTKNQKSIVPYVVVGVVGIMVGFLSSVWI